MIHHNTFKYCWTTCLVFCCLQTCAVMFTVVVSVTYLPLSCPPQEFPDSQWHRYHPNQPVHSRDDPSRHRPAHGVHPCRAGDTLQGAPIWRLQGLHPTQGQGHVLRWGLPINTQHVPKDAGTEMAEGDFGDSHDPKWVILCNTKKGCKVWIGLMAVSCVIHIDWGHMWYLQSHSHLLPWSCSIHLAMHFLQTQCWIVWCNI